MADSDEVFRAIMEQLAEVDAMIEEEDERFEQMMREVYDHMTQLVDVSRGLRDNVTRHARVMDTHFNRINQNVDMLDDIVRRRTGEIVDHLDAYL